MGAAGRDEAREVREGAQEGIKSIQVDEDVHYELKGLAHKNRDTVMATASRLLRKALAHEKLNSGTQG